jgi:hypothetical protein
MYELTVSVVRDANGEIVSAHLDIRKTSARGPAIVGTGSLAKRLPSLARGLPSLAKHLPWGWKP